MESTGLVYQSGEVCTFTDYYTGMCEQKHQAAGTFKTDDVLPPCPSCGGPMEWISTEGTGTETR